MRIAVVGNGPSAPLHAADIDACDFVVRIGGFPYGQAGTKWNAWACNFEPGILAVVKAHGLLRYVNVPDEFWCYNTGADHPDIGRTASAAKFDVARDDIHKMHGALGAKPSSGFKALWIALCRRPASILLVGFDANGATGPGSGHWWGRDDWGEARTKEIGNMGPEKAAIAELQRTGRLIGKDFSDVQLDWRRTP